VDPRLRDGHGLLLEGLVDRDAIVLIHLVELVDADDAAIGNHHRPGLEAPLARLRVGAHGRREPNPRRPATVCVNRQRRNRQNVFCEVFRPRLLLPPCPD
jgi:hypothetical protein